MVDGQKFFIRIKFSWKMWPPLDHHCDVYILFSALFILDTSLHGHPIHANAQKMFNELYWSLCHDLHNLLAIVSGSSFNRLRPGRIHPSDRTSL